MKLPTHLHPSAEVQIASQFVFIALYLIKHRDNFTFAFSGRSTSSSKESRIGVFLVKQGIIGELFLKGTETMPSVYSFFTMK
jgi:hypothetical protein